MSCKANIGFALAISTVASLCSQIPAGALIDAIRDKRRPVRIGLLGIGAAGFSRPISARRSRLIFSPSPARSIGLQVNNAVVAEEDAVGQRKSVEA